MQSIEESWQTAHINMKNDAIMQIVSVFAIGFNKTLSMQKRVADASVTNSNSNFGQIALASDGFKKELHFQKTIQHISQILSHLKITSMKTPVSVDWQSLDVGLTTSVGISSHLYLFAFKDFDDKPPVIIQGYRVGAKSNDVLSLNIGGSAKTAEINMTDSVC